MTAVRRRAVLGAAAAAATVTLLPGRARAAVPVTERRVPAVVVGTGVGGAVAAYRLAAAGVPALVLERGRRWPVTPAGDTFPPFLRPDRRSSYLTPSPVFPLQPPARYRPYAGLFEKVTGDGMSVLCGAGVGGSTLVYAGVWIRPPADVLAGILPVVDAAAMEREYYPRAAARVGIAPIPDDVLAHPNYAGTRLFLDQARRAGLPVERVPNALDWDVVRAELAGRATPSVTVGEYFSGVNSGARNSMDRTYLARAERTGLVEVAPLHRVTGIGTDAAGRYRLDVERIDTGGTVRERLVVVADRVFLGAGSTGTSRLLVRARGTGSLPRLNEHVGRHWGNNGDRIYLRALVPAATGAPQGGPMAVAIRSTDAAGAPVTVAFGPAPLPFEAHLMPMPGFGACDAAGEFRYHPADDTVRLSWPADGDLAAQRSVREVLLALVRADAGGLPPRVGGPLAPLAGRLPDGVRRPATLAAEAPAGLLDLGNLDPVTWHPLGGATLGTACDGHGRVDGYPGLYVVDGALVPGSTGACNPAWTIAALAERCLDDVLARDLDR